MGTDLTPPVTCEQRAFADCGDWPGEIFLLVICRVTDDFARARASAALCPRSAAFGLVAYLGRLLSGCVGVLARVGNFSRSCQRPR